MTSRRKTGALADYVKGPARIALLTLGLMAAALAASGCMAKSGTYAPVDWASEMHYAQSYRSQESPRLAPPVGAVSRTTTAYAIAPDAYNTLENPAPVTEAGSKRGAELFRVNCSMCHGPQAGGNGPVGAFLQKSNYVSPPDLKASATVGKTDGDLFGIISNGVFVMPSFKNLLTPEDLWLIVNYLRSLQNQ